MRGVVLLLAAGEGSRFGSSEPKAFIDIGGVPMVRRALDAALRATLVDAIVIAAPPSDVRRIASLVGTTTLPVAVVTGGTTRQASAFAALDAAPDAEGILVHDVARPLARTELFDAVLRELDSWDAVVPGRPVVDTIKEASGGFVTGTLDRSALVAVETPQGIRTPIYRRAHEAAAADGFLGTDDVSLVERLGIKVSVLVTAWSNPKITHPSDVAVAEALLRAEDE